jgi:ATP-dependent RNA helicase RhlE
VSFTSLKLHPDLLKGIRELGFLHPTPIQADAIPPALDGRDVLACAMTGSGKTAAFLLPILHRLLEKHQRLTRALIVVPTRELAAQVLEDLNDLAVHTPITAAAVFGGVGMGPQEHAFRSGTDVIVATPGRLLDHLRQPYAKLASLEYLVLDEVDRMLDMGFRPDIKRVLAHVPRKRQTLFFSATLPAPIMELTRELLNNPASINVERPSAPPVGITHAVYPVAQEAKSALLLALLERGIMNEALVFTRTKHRANRLWQALDKKGISAARIHGNRSQPQRTDALEGFKSGRYRVLVATDIAARGIDVEALGHVVNFDVPGMPEDYIHRVGRTARAELTGVAFTFVAPDEADKLRDIEKAVGASLPRVVLPDFDGNARSAEALEIPLRERLAAHRARKSEDRARGKARTAGGGAAKSNSAKGTGRATGASSAPASRGARGQGSDDSPYAPSRPRELASASRASTGGKPAHRGKLRVRRGGKGRSR